MQWHLDTQDRTFISRLGNPILNLGLSLEQTYYAALLEDNSVKVVRQDNNKVQTHIRNVKITDGYMGIHKGHELVAVNGNEVQFYDLESKQMQSM